MIILGGCRMSSHVKNQSDVVMMYNRLSIGLLVCVVAVFALAAYFAYASQMALMEKYDQTMNAIRFTNGQTFLTSEVRAFAADGHQVHFDNYWKEVKENRNREIGVESLRAIGITQEEDAMISRMAEISNSLIPTEEAAIELRQKGQQQAAIDQVFGTEYANAVGEINKINAEFRKVLDEREQAKVDRYVMLSRIMNTVLGIMTICIIILQVKNMRYVRKELIQPVQRIQKEMINISKGNLEANLELVPDSSEIGQLIHSLRVTKMELKKYIGDISTKLSDMSDGKLDMDIDINYIGSFQPIKESMQGILKALNYMISQMSTSVTDTANAIVKRSEKVSKGSDTLASGAEEQAKIIEDMSSTVRSLSGEMTMIAESATHSHRDTASAATNLEKSSSKMHEMQSAMEQINTASEGIKKITETIANIGSRTNIVAINAAIEAAKAGDVGRGFAVVADEVRNLAIMCSDASRETDKLLEDTLRSVERGFAITHEITDAMGDLIEVSRASANSVEDIANRSSEQAASLKEVVNGFDHITNVVQQNAATAKESAAAAIELNSQAERLEGLRSLFERFVLRKS